MGDCDFENDDASACGYENYPSNKVDWLIYSGATPSFNTGPVNDHTLGTKEGWLRINPFNTLSVSPTKWSDTLKQFVGNNLLAFANKLFECV